MTAILSLPQCVNTYLNYAGKLGPCLLQGWISILPLLRNDRKCKYIFLFPKWWWITNLFQFEGQFHGSSGRAWLMYDSWICTGTQSVTKTFPANINKKLCMITVKLFRRFLKGQLNWQIEARIFHENKFNAMSADDLAPCVLRSSGAMVLVVNFAGHMCPCLPGGPSGISSSPVLKHWALFQYKDCLSRCRDSHHTDATVSWPFNFCKDKPYIICFVLYWVSPLDYSLPGYAITCSSVNELVSGAGPCLNIKMSSYQHRDPHVKDKRVLRQS